MPITTPPLSAAMNHVLVDYENVHHLDLTSVGDKPVSFVILLGPKQTKLDTEMMEKLMGRASSVELVRLSSPGKNAVDFALAYYLGRAALADPTGYFHLVSKDKGYDPLIHHLRERHINVRRHESFEGLTFRVPEKVAPGAASETTVKVAAVKPTITATNKSAKKAVKKSAKKAAKPSAKKAAKEVGQLSNSEMLEVVRKRLEYNPKSRPSRRKSLSAKVGEVIKEPAESSKVRGLIALAETTGWLSFDEKDQPVYRF